MSKRGEQWNGEVWGWKRGRMRAAFLRTFVSLLSDLLCQSITFSTLDLGVFPLMGFVPGQENCVLSWSCLRREAGGYESVFCCFEILWSFSLSLRIIIAIVTASLSPSVRPETSDNLDVLSCKLQSIQDIDELTKMVGVDGQSWRIASHCMLVLCVLRCCVCVFMWSSAPPASTRRGRWSEQPSDRSETSSSKVSGEENMRRNLRMTHFVSVFWQLKHLNWFIWRACCKNIGRDHNFRISNKMKSYIFCSCLRKTSISPEGSLIY